MTSLDGNPLALDSMPDALVPEYISLSSPVSIANVAHGSTVCPELQLAELLQLSKVKHTNDRAQVLIMAPEVTLIVVHEVNTFGTQLDAVDGAVNTLCNKLLQKDSLKE
ncbi:hypothetical protein PR048_015160 [Dryococelus australis]|uniref:Uncharacterized protein n=1 Tax=Dryococelus australis TaxID=614101 RepID=A0ABQ9HG65_9NEOP|nr:hypothetical protein PR048_015160 [Dryococelus australis]